MAFLTNTVSADMLGMISAHPDGVDVLSKWLNRVRAPKAHKFATGIPGATRRDVKQAINRADGKKEDVLDKAHWGCTPLDIAMACDNVNTLEELLKLGADPNNKNGLAIESTQDMRHMFDAHPIHTAIYFRRPKCLEALLSAQSSVVEAYPDKPNETVQHALFKIDGSRAGTEESMRVMKILLSSKEGQEAVDVLIGHKTDPETVYQTPLASCITTSWGIDVKNNSKHHSALLEVIKMFLEAGASPTKTCTQLPPLQLTCHYDIDPKVASMLIDHGANPNQYAGSTGETCLYSALKNSRVETVKILLRNDVDVNGLGPNGKRPFDGICEAKYFFDTFDFIDNHPEFRIKKTKLPAGASRFTKCDLLLPEEQYYKYPYGDEKEEDYVYLYPEHSKHDSGTDSILDEFVIEGNVNKLTDILNKCSTKQINEQDKKSRTALHNAVIKNDIDMVELLLDKGADVNLKDDAGNTPLNYAAKRPNSLEVIEMLLAKGASVNQTGFQGKTALFQATEYGRVENVEYLCVTKNAKVNIEESFHMTVPLHVAAQDNNMQILEILLNSPGVDVNIFNTFGAAPLHYTSRTNAKEATSRLINKGADVHHKCDMMESTPLHVAAACNSVEVAHVLIEASAKINDKNKCEETPLFLAAATGSTSMVTYLLDQGAEIDAKNIHGHTPLYIAVSYEEFESAKILIERGADIEARDKHRNETILHIAVSAGNVEFIKYLLSKGVDKEAKDFHGLTPLLRSAAIRSPGLTSTLLQHGCDARATLSGPPDSNVIDLMEHNSNVVGFNDIVSVCPKTKKPKLHPYLKSLPRKSKDDALSIWKEYYASKSKK